MKYDIVVVGAGPGGYVCAIKAAQLGFSVAVVEDRELGGTCLNRGCIPAKALLHSAEVLKEIQSAEQFGIMNSKAEIDIEKVFSYKDSVSKTMRDGVEALLKGNHITVYHGKGTIGEGHILSITNKSKSKDLEGVMDITIENIKYDKLVIATGSVPSKPPISGIDLPGVITSDEVFRMNDKIPSSLVIIGGGVIAVEFAQIYAGFGTKVIIIEAMSRILPMMDKEISRNLNTILKKRGVEIHTDARVESIESTTQGLQVFFEKKGKNLEVSGENVLVAVGRRSNTEGLFEEKVSLTMNRGKIVTDDNFLTSKEDVYAIGDVTEGIQLAHAASAQGIAVSEGLAGKERSIDLSVVPSCVYTSPEIACVGMTESEAVDMGIQVKTGKFLTSANGKSVISKEERGFIKVVFDEKSGILLGAQLMCARATDMIGEMATAVANHMSAPMLLKAMRAHPTVNESIGEAIEDSLHGAIHIMPRRKK